MKQKIAKEPLTPGSSQEKRFQKVEKTTVDRRFVERGERTEGKNPSLDALEKRLQSLQQKQLTWSVDVDQTEVDALKDEIIALYREIEQTKLTLEVDVVANMQKKEDLDKQFEEINKPEEKSSFEKAMPVEKIPEGDYEGRIAKLEKELDTIDELIKKNLELAEARKKANDESGYEQSVAKVKELTEEQAKLSSEVTTTATKGKKFNKFIKGLEDGAGYVENLGSAFASLGEMSESPELNIAGTIAQAIANVMLGYAQASVAVAQTGNPFLWAAFALSGLAIALSTAS